MSRLSAFHAAAFNQMAMFAAELRRQKKAGIAAGPRWWSARWELVGGVTANARSPSSSFRSQNQLKGVYTRLATIMVVTKICRTQVIQLIGRCVRLCISGFDSASEKGPASLPALDHEACRAGVAQ
jgi:hypothetical protein